MSGEYRIDDLAQAAGMTVRNVRSYQERGLLMSPTRREGRAAIYDESHLERLRLIDALLQKGFTAAHIGDFITSWETGKDLTEVLGLQHAVVARWGVSTTQPIAVPRELAETFLGTADAALLDQLAELGIVELEGDTVLITQPQLLDTFGILKANGMELPQLVTLFSKVNTHITDSAQMMIRAVKAHISAQRGTGWLPETDADIKELTAMISNFREVGVSVVHTMLANALDEVLKDELADYLAGAANARHPDIRPSRP